MHNLFDLLLCLVQTCYIFEGYVDICLIVELRFCFTHVENTTSTGATFATGIHPSHNHDPKDDEDNHRKPIEQEGS